MKYRTLILCCIFRLSMTFISLCKNPFIHRTYHVQTELHSSQSSVLIEALNGLRSDTLTPGQAKNFIDTILVNFQDMPERLWIKLLDTCIRWKFPESAMKTFLLMCDQNIPCSSHQLSWILLWLCDEGRFDDALNALDQSIALGLIPTSQHFSSLLRSCSSLSRVRDILQRMETAGLTPNVIIFTAAMKSCERLGNWQGSLALLAHMHAAGVVPNDVTYVSIITACARGRAGAMAVNVLREMQASGMKPNNIHYASVLSACARCEMWSQAMLLLQEMEDFGIPLYESVLISVINICRETVSVMKTNQPRYNSRSTPLLPSESTIPLSKTSRYYDVMAPWERAIWLLNSLSERVVDPTESMFTIVMDVCEASNRTHEVVRVYESMKSFGQKPGKSTFHFVLRAALQLRDPELGVSIVKDAQEANVDTGMLYGATMNLCSVTGRSDLAVKVLRYLLDRSEQQKVAPPPAWFSRRILNDALESLTRRFSSSYTEVVRGQLSPSVTVKPFIEDVTTILKSASASNHKLMAPSVYPMAVKLLLDSDDFDTLRPVLRSASHVHLRDASAQRQAVSTTDFMRLYEFAIKSLLGKLPQRVSVLHILELISDVNQIPDQGSTLSKSLLLLAMHRIFTYHRAARVDSDSLTAPSKHNYSIQSRRRAVYPRDRFVMYLFRHARSMISKDVLPIRAFILAAKAARRSLRPDWTLEIYRNAVEDGIAGTNLVLESHVLYTLARSARHWDTALDIFETIRTLHQVPDSILYTCALVACETGRDWKRALCILDSMHKDGPAPNTYSYTTAISVCGSCGQAPLALSLLEQMKERGVPRTLHTFNSAITACARSGMWKEALGVFEALRQTDDVSFHVTYPQHQAVTNTSGLYDGKYLNVTLSVEGNASDVKNIYNNDLHIATTSGNTQTVNDITDRDFDVDKDSQMSLSKKNKEEVQEDSADSIDSVDKIEDMEDLEDGEIEEEEDDDETVFIQPHKAGKLRPDIITYNTLVQALGEGGQDALIDDVYTDAIRQGVFRSVYHSPEGWVLDLHKHSVQLAKGAVRVAFHRILDMEPNMFPNEMMIVVGRGSKLLQAVETQLADDFRPSIRAKINPFNPGCLDLVSSDIKAWLDAHSKMKRSY